MGSPHAPRSGASDPSRYLPTLAGRHVVFLNWRDRAHPQAGGAELFCESVAERFAAAGVRVTLLTSRVSPDGAPPAAAAQVVAGVDVRRGGGTFGVYPSVLARLASISRAGHRVDAVVDCQNGIPFFSPLVLSGQTPVVQVLHHVHQKQFPLYFPGPVARIGQLLEAPGSRLVYRRRPSVVVSPSTREEARAVLGLPGPRYLVPNGVTAATVPSSPQEVGPAVTPTIVCVGRLVPHKRLHLLLDALPALLEAHPGLVVHIVGDGPDRERLTAHAVSLGLSAPAVAAGDPGGPSGPTAAQVVHWHGQVAAPVRDRLLASAWLTVNPSHGEGWGLSVLEAAALGVPAVAFRVPGLRDAVRDGTTGWLVRDGEPLGPAIDAGLRLLAEPAAAADLRAAARAWAAGFTWDASAELLARVVSAEIDRLTGPAVDARSRARERRRIDDDLTRATFTLPVHAGLPALRRTDLVYRPDPAGEQVVAVLYGADARQARTALERVGVTTAPGSGGLRLRPGTGTDLLLAAGQATANPVSPASPAPPATAATAAAATGGAEGVFAPGDQPAAARSARA
ncbi:glycosyltransferase family 4 protein [Frankia sp. Ag45/Mut15]|uniref:Glycosyltransferase family 4 protein n=1 Tax=Frankia umida TaxID=573489 RepID=A0ABT0JXR2_9ACTN|nr:glycosyltransferase family 4 protein [Frankia umida]MCK9876335.1 glycosyltransferase family 4 protein [Frankia umida]